QAKFPAEGLRKVLAAHSDFAGDVRDSNVGAVKAPESEGESWRNFAFRTELQRCGLREHFDLPAQRARLSQPISKLRRWSTKGLRSVHECIAKLLQRKAQKKSRAKEAELDLRACLRPVRFRYRIGRARAAIESLTLAEFTPRAYRVLDKKFPAEMEDQYSGAVRQFTAAAKRRPAFVVSVNRADEGVEGLLRFEPRDAPRSGL